MKNLRRIATLALAMVVTGTSIPQIAFANPLETTQLEAAEKEYVIGETTLDMTGYKADPVFAEDFAGDSLNTDVWNVEAHEPGWVNSEWQEYVDADHASENIIVTDGVLNIIPKKIAVQEGNMFTNADFLNEMTGWSETIANWGGEYVTNASSRIGDGKIIYDIHNPGTEDWHIQLKQELPLEQDKKYKVTFDIRSNVARTIMAGVQTLDYASLATGVDTSDESDNTFSLEAGEKKTITIHVNDKDQITEDQTGAFYISMGKIDGNTPTESTIEISNLMFTALDETGAPVATTKYEYTSGRINTQNKQTFTYGLFECRAKVPEGQGYLPAFWLMANDENLYGQWPRCGEIDCMEVMGQEPDKVYGTIHYGNPHSESQGTKVLDENSFADDYHLFQCEWLPGRINWYVDGVLYHTENDWHSTTEGKGTLSYPAPFDQPFYIILNLAVGGSWVGYPDESTSFEDQAYSIDYVKVYQKDFYDENVTKPEKTESWREPDSDGNYIINGDFANYPFAEENDWEFMTAGGGEATCSATDHSLTIDTTSEGTVDYSVQLVQAGVPLKKTAKYRVSFEAWASAERETGVAVKAPDRGWIAYYNDDHVQLTTAKQNYSFEFTMTKDSDPNARLEFNMGAKGSNATIHLENVKIEKIQDEEEGADDQKTVLSDGNYIYNGAFQEGDGRLGFWTVSTESMTASVTDLADGRRLKADVATAGASISQSDLAFIGGQYELSFDAEGAGTITANIAGVTKTVTTTAEKKSYAVKVTLPETMSNKDFSLTFDTAGTYYIDNIRFVEDSLIKNGSFHAGDAGFEVYVSNDAQAVSVVDSLSEDHAMDFTINNTSDAEWKIQLKQSNVVVEQDQCYKLSFKAKSSIERTIQYALQRNGAVHKTESGAEDWTPYAQATVSLPADDTSYTEIVNYFKMSNDTDEGTVFNIALGGGNITQQHRVCIDDIVLEKIDESQMPAVDEPRQPVNTNLLTNGDFANGSAGWTNGVTDVEASWNFNEGSAKATITNLNDQTGSWRVKLQQTGLTLVKGKTYTVTAKITSDTARTIEFASMDSANANWYVQGDNKVVFEEAGTKDVQFTVSTGENDTDTDAYIAFNLGVIDGIETPAASTITIDDVCMMIVEENKAETPSTPVGPIVDSGSSTTPATSTATKPVDTENVDGTTTNHTTITKNEDGTITEIRTETTTNEAGKEVETTVTIQKDADGNVTGSTEVSTIVNIAKNTDVTVTVEKDADGEVTDAAAEVTRKGVETENGTKGTIAGVVVDQIKEAAGTTDIDITTTVTDAKGKELYSVTVNASDLIAGEKLTVVLKDEKTGKVVLVDAKQVKVTVNGGVNVVLPEGKSYTLIDAKEATAVTKEILKTVVPAKKSVTMATGKKVTAQLSKKLDMDNVKKITYTSSKKSVATIDKNGKVAAKKAGTVTISIKVTLNNGSTKTVKMKYKVQ